MLWRGNFLVAVGKGEIFLGAKGEGYNVWKFQEWEDIVACQAHPALVKIGPVLVPSFYF